MRGRFITLEGGEGAGKSTQARLLAEALRGRGKQVLLTREPGGAPEAERLRSLLLEPGADWSPLAETLLHFAARAEHVARTIRPALESGTWVISDRFADSTMAYQGYGQGADREAIRTLTGMIGVSPDLTLVLDAPEDVLRARRRARGRADDRYETLDEAFHRRVADGFRTIAREAPERCVMIDAGAAEDAVQAAILYVVAARWPR